MTEVLTHEWVKKDKFVAKHLRLSPQTGEGKEVTSATVMKIFVVSDLKVKPTHLYEQETWNTQKLHKSDHPGHLNSVCSGEQTDVART